MDTITKGISIKMSNTRELEYGNMNMVFIWENGILVKNMESSEKKKLVPLIGMSTKMASEKELIYLKIK